MFKFFYNLFCGKGLSLQVKGDRMMIVYKGEITDKMKADVEKVLTGKAHARAYPKKREG